MTDISLQRKNMVESQVRTSDVTDRRITAAMAEIPREQFVPPSLQSLAYCDETLSIAPGRDMLAPRVLAKLIQLAEIDEDDRVLVIGGACGYAAAIVARLAKHVTALLPDANAAEAAGSALRGLNIENVTIASGTFAAGWPSKAPYDVIILEGGADKVPDAVQAQLGEGGRLTAIGGGEGLGHAYLLHKTMSGVSQRDDFQASAAYLPGFEAARPSFVF